jgi:hypothetical protein
MFWDKVKSVVKKTVEVVEKIDSSLEKAERKCLKGKSVDEIIKYEEYSDKVSDAMLHPVETVKKVKNVKVKEKTVAIKKRVGNKIIRPVVKKMSGVTLRYRVVKTVVKIVGTVFKKTISIVDSILVGLFGGAKKEIVVRKVESN